MKWNWLISEKLLFDIFFCGVFFCFVLQTGHSISFFKQSMNVMWLAEPNPFCALQMLKREQQILIHLKLGNHSNKSNFEFNVLALPSSFLYALGIYVRNLMVDGASIRGWHWPAFKKSNHTHIRFEPSTIHRRHGTILFIAPAHNRILRRFSYSFCYISPSFQLPSCCFDRILFTFTWQTHTMFNDLTQFQEIFDKTFSIRPIDKSNLIKFQTTTCCFMASKQ